MHSITETTVIPIPYSFLTQDTSKATYRFKYTHPIFIILFADFIKSFFLKLYEGLSTVKSERDEDLSGTGNCGRAALLFRNLPIKFFMVNTSFLS